MHVPRFAAELGYLSRRYYRQGIHEVRNPFSAQINCKGTVGSKHGAL